MSQSTQAHMARWRAVADQSSSYDELVEQAPATVACKFCWDLGLCPECLGDYPLQCPAGCSNGKCACQRENTQ